MDGYHRLGLLRAPSVPIYIITVQSHLNTLVFTDFYPIIWGLQCQCDIGIEKKSLKNADIDRGNQFCISLLSANGSLKRFSNRQPICGKARAPANSWCQSACQCWLPTWLRLIFSNKTSVGLRNLQKIENSSSAQEKLLLAGTTLFTIKIMIYANNI